LDLLAGSMVHNADQGFTALLSVWHGVGDKTWAPLSGRKDLLLGVRLLCLLQREIVHSTCSVLWTIRYAEHCLHLLAGSELLSMELLSAGEDCKIWALVGG